MGRTSRYSKTMEWPEWKWPSLFRATRRYPTRYLAAHLLNYGAKTDQGQTRTREPPTGFSACRWRA